MDNLGELMTMMRTRVKMKPIRRVVASVLVYTMLATNLLTSFAATGGWDGSDSNGFGGATSSNASSEDGRSDEKTTLTGQISFMSDDGRDRPRPNLKLYVNGELKDDVVVLVDKNGTYKATGSNATMSDAISDVDEVPVFDDRPLEVQLESEDESNDYSGEAFDVWTYYVENLPVYDEDGSPYQYSVRDENYSEATASNALFYFDANHNVIGEAGEWEDYAIHLTYVKTGEIGGTYEGGADMTTLPAQIPLKVSATDSDDEEWLGMAEGWINTGAGTWTIADVLLYNPLTGQPIEWRASVDAEYYFEFTYNNIEDHEGYGDYVYNGGTIFGGRRSVAAEGSIVWEDEADYYGKRPQSGSFLKLYTESGEDITEQSELEVISQNDDSWTYRINRLPVGGTYQLVQTSQHYQTQETEITVDEAGQVVASEPLVMRPNTRTYRGSVYWESEHPMYAIPEGLDFLKVYENGKDITESLSIELIGQEDPMLWFYTIEGLLADGLYTVKIEPPTGYQAERYEYVIRPVTIGLRTLGGGDMIGPFVLRANSLRKIVIENVTGGVSNASSLNFVYNLKVNGQDYGGLYQVLDKDGEVSETSNGPGITLKGNESKTIQVEADVKVEQDNDSASAAGVKWLTTEIVGENTFRFIYAGQMTEKACVIWNDNQNEADREPTKAKNLHSAMTLLYRQKNTNGEYTRITDANYNTIGLTKEEFGAMFKYQEAVSGIAEWNYEVHNLPTHIYNKKRANQDGYDANGWLELEYKIEIAQPVTEGIYEYQAFEKGEEGSRNDAWTIMLSKQLTLKERIKWLDGNNGYNTRMSIDEPEDALKESLTLYRKSTKPGSGPEIENIERPKSFVYSTSQIDGKDVWDIEISGLKAYDDEGYPYVYYLTQEKPQVESNPNLMNKDFPISYLEYVTVYDNTGNHATEQEAGYENVEIKHTLTGKLEFNTKIKWEDNDRDENDRPVVTGELWRYVNGSSPKEASRVQGVSVDIPKKDGEITLSVDNLPLFDEDGQEYVYFINKTSYSGQYTNTFDNHTAFKDELGSTEYLFNGGTLIKTRSETISVPVTKEWKAKAVQGAEFSVELELQRRLKGETPEGEWTYVARKEIDEFTAEHMIKSWTFGGLPKYSDKGEEYEYRVIEVGVRSSLGEFKGFAGELELPKNTADFEYMLGEYEFIREYNAADGTIVNRLIGKTVIEIDKRWENVKDEDIADELHFHILRDGVDICENNNVNNHEGGLIITKPDPSKGDITHWNPVFVEYDKYDGNGKQYTYSVIEDIPGGIYYDVNINYEYGKSAGANYDHLIVKVVNGPGGGDKKPLWAIKEWLDDSDTMHREPVTVALMKKDADGGKSQVGTGVLSEANAWKIKFFIDANEDYENYSIEELRIGDKEVVANDDEKLVKLGFGGTDNRYIITADHIYQVLEDIEPTPNEKGQYILRVRNRRVGKVNIEITKKWVDPVDIDGYSVVFQLEIDGVPVDGKTVTLEDFSEGKGTVAFTGLDKYDEFGAVINYGIKEITVFDEDERSAVGDDGNFTFKGNQYSSAASQTKYTPGAMHHTGDLYKYEFMNWRSGSKDIVFHKLWKDHNEDDGVKRPDIYLNLYRAVDAIPEELTKGEYVRALPELKVNDDYHWTYTYKDMPKYNAEGKPYLYYAVEGMPAPVSGGWKQDYYGELQSDETISDATVPERKTGGNYMPENGIVVNRRDGEINITGEKIWLNMGGLRSANYPAINIYLYVARWDAKDGFGTPQPVMENGSQAVRTIEANANGVYDGTYTFGTHPKYDSDTGELLRYSVTEAPVTSDLEGFTWLTNTTDFVMVNSFESEQKLQVKVLKEWSGFTGAPKDGYPVLEFELYREMQFPGSDLSYEVEKVGNSEFLVMDPEEASGEVTFAPVDYYAPNGLRYVYYLREKIQGGSDFTVPGYDNTRVEGVGLVSAEFVASKGHKLIYGEPDGTNMTVAGTWKITNHFEDEKIKIEGTKSWTDKDQGWGEEKFRPDRNRVKIFLHRRINGKEDETFKIAATWRYEEISDNWEYYFKNEGSEYFDKYATTGKQYQYYVTEDLTGYTGKSKPPQLNGDELLVDIENELNTVDISVEKKWVDENNQYKTRPSEIQVKLQRRIKDGDFEDVNKPGGDEPWIETIIIDDATINSGTYKPRLFTGLPENKLDWNSDPVAVPYEYRVVEVSSDSLGDYTLPDENKDDENGYMVEETSTGFKVLFTNKMKDPSDTEIKVEKKWNDDEDRDDLRPGSVTVGLYRDGGDEPIDTAILEEKPNLSNNSNTKEYGTWSVIWRGWPKYRPGTMIESKYTIAEIERSEYYRDPMIERPVNQTGAGTWIITNTHEPIEDLELTFTKTWADENDMWKNRPDSIKVQLYRKTKDSSEEAVEGQDKVVKRNDQGTWKVTFTGLRYAKENGKVYTYYVKEDPVLGYLNNTGDKKDTSNEVTPEITGEIPPTSEGGSPGYNYVVDDMTITNRLAVTNLFVKKVWDDSDNKYNTRPESITVRLQRKTSSESKYEDVLDPTVSAPNEPTVWEKTIPTTGSGADESSFKYLPLYKDGTNQEYEYRVVETAMNFRDGEGNLKLVKLDKDGTFADFGGGYTIDVTKNGEQTTITNTLLTLDTVLNKEWFDDFTGYNRNEEIVNVTFKLQRSLNGVTFEDVKDKGNNDVTYVMTPDASKEHTYKFESLPRYNSSGEEYKYRMVESEMTIKKQDGSGNIVEEVVTTDELTGQLGIYTFDTAWKAADGTTPSVTTVKNTTTGRSVTATKHWDDANNQDGRRPDSVTLELMQDGEPFKEPKLVVLDGTPDTVGADDKEYESAPWTAFWDGLPAYHADGTPYSYTIVEVKMGNDNGSQVNGYNQEDGQPIYSEPSTSVETELTVTNVKTPETVDYKVRKFWIGDENWLEDRPDSIQVQLFKFVNKEKTAVGEPVTLKNSDDDLNKAWTYTWAGLPKYENIGGTATTPGTSHEIEYLAEEIVPEDGFGYNQLASGSNAIQNTLKTTELNVVKRWDDQDNRFERRPDEITIQLQRSTNGINWINAGDPEILRMDGSNEQDVLFIGLPIRDKDNRTYQYRAIEVRMDNEEVVKGKALGYTVTYKHIPNMESVSGETVITNKMETTEISGTKTWNDQNNRYHTRPENIDLELEVTPSDALSGMQLTSDDAVWEKDGNVWKYTFGELPKYDTNGAAIRYTVKELHQPPYEVTYSNDTMDLTNTLKTVNLAGLKTWVDQSNRFGTRPDAITLVVKQNGVAIEPQPDIEWTKDGDVWSWKADSLPRVNGDNVEYTYTVEEQPVNGYTATQNGYNITNALGSGSLSVTKNQIGGSTRDFTFRVKLHINGTERVYTGAYKVLAKDAAWTGEGTLRNTDDAGAIVIRRNEKFVLTELPAGFAYTVSEDSVRRYYISEQSGETGIIPDGSIVEAQITNRYSSTGGGGGGGGGSTGGFGGPGDPSGPGTTLIGDDGVPLGGLEDMSGDPTLNIDDDGVPLGGLAKTGDTSLPYALLFTIMLGAAALYTTVTIKRKRDEE